MKRINKIFTVVAMLLLVLLTAKAAWGAVVINEVMYNPSSAQGDDSDLEWIELYNNGADPVDLTAWTIDGNNFGDVTLAPEEYLIIAKELLDGTDTDSDSFESFYGNGDGVWDASDGIYKAVDGDFSLTNTGDTITLTNGVDPPETVLYKSSWGGDGNGKSIEKKDALGDNSETNWQEGNVGGTPGTANNIAPVAQDVTASTEEDTEITVPLAYTDGDGDLAKTCKVFNEKGGSVTSCSCTAGVCTAILKPNSDSIKTITADYTVNDGTVDSNTAKISVTVTEKNDPPALSIPDDAIEEDSFNAISKKYELRDYASDAEDSKDKLTFEVKSQSDASVVNCQLAVDKHTLECKTLPEKSGESKVEIIVYDTKSESATDDFTIIVSAVNDAPIIDSILCASPTAVEGVKYPCEVKAHDVDNKPEELFVSPGDSELFFLEVNDKNKLMLSGSPTKNDVDIKTEEISIVISDGDKLSEKKTANIIVKPVLEITEVKVNGIAVEEDKTTIPVQSGEEYTIEVKLTNNLDSPLLGVAVNGEDLDADADISFKDKETNIYLAKGSPKIITLTETAPNTESEGIQVGINAVDLFGWGKYSDQFLFSLVVKKPLASLKITAAAWEGKEAGEKAELYCAKDLSLVVYYDNYGAEEVTNVNFVVEDNSGKEIVLDSKQVESTVSGGETGEATLKFNTDNIKSLVLGTSFTLKVKFSYEVKGFPLSVEINTPIILKQDCFTPPNPLLELYEGEKLYDGKLGKEVDLKTFTPSTQLEENKEEVSYTEFTDEVLVTEDEEKVELATCTLSAEGLLTCTPKDDVSGTATLTIALNGIEEKVNIKVNPTIKITDVKVKGKSVEEGKSSTGVKPLEEFAMDITVTNHWDTALKYVKFKFDQKGKDLGLVDKEFFNENIAPGSSKSFPITQKLDNKPSSEESITITATAKDETLSKDKEVDDTFDFDLTVGQEASEVQITKLKFVDSGELKDTAETYCNPALTLSMEYSNSGESAEPDMELVITDEKGQKVKDSAGKEGWKLLDSPEETKTIDFSTIDMALGEHALTATLTYHDKQKSDSETIKLTKQDCLNIPADKLTITEEDSGIALDLKEFLVGEEDKKDAQNGGLNLKFNLKVTSQSNKDLISCNIVWGASILHCDWPFGKVPPDNALAQSLKEGESKTNNIEVTLDYDGVGNVLNKEQFTITVTGKNDAPAFTKEMSINFDEDETAKVKLSDYIKDPDNSASELTIQVSGNEKVTLTKDGENLIFGVEKDWSGTEEFDLIATDPAGLSSETKKVTVTVNSVEDVATPAEEPFSDESISGEKVGPITDDEDYKLIFPVNNPEKADLSVKWYVDGKLPKTDTGGKGKPGFNSEYTFNAKGKAGEFTVKAEFTDKNGKIYSKEWVITTTCNPVDLEEFGYTQELECTNINKVTDLTLENSYGKIQFSDKVDLSKVAELAKVVKISDGLVAIDSQKAPGLDKAATITLKKTFKKHTILMSDSFDSGSFKVCPASVCKAVSNTDGEFVFTVSGFSTYKVVEEQPAGITISPSEFNFEEVNRSTDTVSSTVNATFTVTNVGSGESLTGLTAKFTGSTKYKANLVLDKNTLAPGESANVTLTITVPKDEDGGKHFVGKLQISAANAATQSVDIYLAPLSYLKIEDIEINGDNDGELIPGKENDFEIKVQNDYTEDIQDITVTVTIKDVDGDDLEEESESFDLDEGDDDSIKVSIDLSGEQLDEEEYEVEITVQGEADDNSDQETTETLTVQVDREKHKIVLNSVELSAETLQCLKQTTLHVDLENVGQSNEDGVEIKVKNTALGVDEKRSNIELDEFSGSDNEYSATFEIDAENAAPGNYPLIVELYRDGKQEDSASVNLEVKECLTISTATQQQDTYSNEQLAAQLQQQLEQQLAAKKAAEEKAEVTIAAPEKTFRDSEEYNLLLWALVVLVAIAVILELAVLAKPRRRMIKEKEK